MFLFTMASGIRVFDISLSLSLCISFNQMRFQILSPRFFFFFGTFFLQPQSTHTHTNAYISTRIRIGTYTHTHQRIHKHEYPLSLNRTLSHTCTFTHPLSHIRIHTHNNAYTYTPTYTQTCITSFVKPHPIAHIHIHINPRTHTHKRNYIILLKHKIHKLDEYKLCPFSAQQTAKSISDFTIKLQAFLKKWANHGLFFVFLVFSNKYHYKFYNKSM